MTSKIENKIPAEGQVNSATQTQAKIQTPAPASKQGAEAVKALDASIKAGTIKAEGKKAVVKKEAVSAAPKVEAKVEAVPAAPLTEISQSDLAINKWGDLFFSTAHKQIAKNPEFQLKTDSDVFFAVDAEKELMTFKEKTDADVVGEFSFTCLYKKRCVNRFYFRKDAQSKIAAAFGKIEDLKFRIVFLKNKSGTLYLQ